MEPVLRDSASSPATIATIGSKDGDGAGDHDQPYRFGRRPTYAAPFPFTTRQFARLLILRSKIDL